MRLNMNYCPSCGKEISPEDNFCKNCGKRLIKTRSERPESSTPRNLDKPKSKSGNTGTIVVLVIVLFFVAVIILSNLGKRETHYTNNSSNADNKTSTYNYQETKYAHKNINVRSGRGTNFKIVGCLKRGDKVKIDSSQNGWAIVYQNCIKKGYVYESLLKNKPIPPFEIVSWNWRTDPSFRTDGAVIWNVQIRNNTNHYVSRLKVDLTTYDASGNIIESDFAYVSGLSPGGTSSAKSYATYLGREEKAGTRIDPSDIY